MRFLPFILAIVVTIYALVDCVRYEEEPLPGGVPKPLWVVLILVLLPIGAIAWLVVSRISTDGDRRQAGPSRPTFSPPSRPARPPRPVAPDDDPDFLASLGRPDPPEEDDGHGDDPDSGDSDGTEDGGSGTGSGRSSRA